MARKLIWIVTPLAGLLLGTGCSRSLVIHKTDYINTAMHADRAPDKQTGEPLDVTVVVVFDKDLKEGVNDRLKPDSSITSREWYERRPQPGDNWKVANGPRFRVPPDQVYVLTDETTFYGTKIGNAVRGAKLDNSAVVKSDEKVKAGDARVMYVFPRFISKDGTVLDVRPAVFEKPKDTRDFNVTIGVDSERKRGKDGQYIEVK